MCLAIPCQIKKLENQLALVTFGIEEGGGVEREVNLQLLDDSIKVGDWILVHTGYAVTKIDEKEALKTLEEWKIIKRLMNEENARIKPA